MMWTPNFDHGELTAQEYRSEADRVRLLRLAFADATPTPVRHALATTLQRWGQTLVRTAQHLDPTLHTSTATSCPAHGVSR